MDWKRIHAIKREVWVRNTPMKCCSGQGRSFKHSLRSWKTGLPATQYLWHCTSPESARESYWRLRRRTSTLKRKPLTVNKSYQRLGREDIVTTPKTPKSNRTIPIPDGLCTCLQEYMSHCYGLQKDDRLFPYTKSFLYHEMEYGCKASGVKRIRVHDIRHSHASLLVEMGFSPLLIAERLGHEKVQTTMDTYSHLYPNKQVEVARQLDGIMPWASGYKNCCKCSQFVADRKEKSWKTL